MDGRIGWTRGTNLDSLIEYSCPRACLHKMSLRSSERGYVGGKEGRAGSRKSHGKKASTNTSPPRSTLHYILLYDP